MTPGAPPWGGNPSGSGPSPFPTRSAGNAAGLGFRIIVRLILVAAVGVGLGYVGEWGRTKIQAQDGWSEAVTPSNSYRMSLPRPAVPAEFGPAESLRSADDDWEIVFVETRRSGVDPVLKMMYGPEVTADRMGGAARATLDPLGGKVVEVKSLRHPLGRDAVVFSGTYRRGAQERYLKEVVIQIRGGSVVTLRVEANGSRSELVDFLFDEVDGSLSVV